MLLKILFVLVALTALVLLFVPVAGDAPESGALEGKLMLGAVFATSLGMIVPWGRWIPWSSPGRSLGFLSKLLGWAGAGGVPLAVASGHVIAILVCILLPICAFALWRKRAWAAWPWYGVALASFALAVQGLMNVFSAFSADDSSVSSASALGSRTGAVFGVVLYGAIGVALLREVTAWRRVLSSSGGTPGSST